MSLKFAKNMIFAEKRGNIPTGGEMYRSRSGPIRNWGDIPIEREKSSETSSGKKATTQPTPSPDRGPVDRQEKKGLKHGEIYEKKKNN